MERNQPALRTASRLGNPNANLSPLPAMVSPDALFAGGGEAGSIMRGVDWATTPLGSVEQWPQSLRTCVRIILTSRQPMFVWWGSDLINLYNDAYKTIVGGKHPAALGRPAKEVWKEIWDQVSPRAEFAIRANEGTYDESLLLLMERYGYKEETYYTFSYSPVPNELGGVGGIICANTDDTERIVGERQVALLKELAARTSEARTWRDACKLCARSLERDLYDICFALIYFENDQRDCMELAGCVPEPCEDWIAPTAIRADEESCWPIYQAGRTQEIRFVHADKNESRTLPCGAWSEPPHTIAIVPIAPSVPGARSGAMVIGLNPYRLVDDKYVRFLELLAGQVSASIANAEAWEQERRRAEALAELDRAKTLFFSNVSHEFRTPLTLMLGPLEELLSAQSDRPTGPGMQQVETVHRNAVRLLRLVNTLLDFSRIEAGRVRASFRQVDLAALTNGLASSFQSAMAKAQLSYSVTCDSLPESVYVDVEMWEKIVLNLLSNAFKFTFHGSVQVTLSAVDGAAELAVRDTGTGIPPAQLLRIFERFHRIEGAVGRTHEGTGIGLALVDELVRLHGGTVQAESEPGVGSEFRVRLPFGRAHLPQEQIVAEDKPRDGSMMTVPFLQEVICWLPDEVVDSSAPERDKGTHAQDAPEKRTGHREPHARVLLADDNRDMREYVQRLLGHEYRVDAVADGAQALAAAMANPPDLVLTDVMMPGMDGFELLKAIRSHPSLASVPVVMLSARAGEDSRSEGIEAGADDYIVKPFTARELTARVRTHIGMHRMRRAMTAREQALRAKAEDAERQYRRILESISEGFLFVDKDWHIQYVNDRFVELSFSQTGDFRGKVLWDVSPELADSELGNLYRESMETGEITRTDVYFEPLQRWLHANAYPSEDGLAIVVQDVHDWRLQQERLILSEKLAATGRLAATISHEINNPLASVLNLVYLARTSKGEQEKVREYLKIAERELTRVAHIARHTLSFYRETSVAGDIDLLELLEEVLAVYEGRLRAFSIQVQKDLLVVPMIHGIRGELHQLFSNLISNAIDAMPNGGILTLNVRESAQELREGLTIIVQDNGTGISPQNLSRIFDPFFTTKASSGTGLGLWVVNQMIDAWKGIIRVESNSAGENQGTKFTVHIPRVSLSEKNGETIRAKIQLK